MWYWYQNSKDLRLTDSLQKETIKVYQQLTGVQGASLDDIRTAYAHKSAVDLELVLAETKKQERRKKVWKTVAILGVPISFGVGVVGTVYLISR